MSGNVDMKGFLQLQKDLEKMQAQIDPTIRAIAKELTARLLAKVVHKTPVGDYSKTIEVVAKRDSKKHKKGEKYTKKISTKRGGTLRRGWTSDSHEEAESGKETKQSTYADSLQVHTYGDVFVIELLNPVEYAPYVEYGHRTANHKGWVEGRFMLTMSVKEIERQAPKVIEQQIEKALRRAFGGG